MIVNPVALVCAVYFMITVATSIAFIVAPIRRRQANKVTWCLEQVEVLEAINAIA